MGILRITHLSIYTKDQNDALHWYTEKLGFKTCEDIDEFMPGFRWLTVAPSNDSSTQIILMPIINDSDRGRVGNNPMFVLSSDDCHKDYQHLASRGVNFVDPPKNMPWGVSAMFTDLYDNPYSLVQRAYHSSNQI